MNIGFDAKRAFHNFSGLGVYSRALLASLITHYPENNYALFTPKFKPHSLHCFAENANCEIITPKGISSLLPSPLWRSYLMANDINNLKIDIFHGLSGELPNCTLKMPKVVTIHDVIFLRYPEFYTKFDRKMYEKKFKHACKIADKILVISEQTANDCVQYLNANPKKIEICYQSYAPIFNNINNKVKEVEEKYSLPKPFILNVGTIEPRKNLLNLIKSLQFIDDEIWLVAIGKRTPYTKLIDNYLDENPHLKSRVKLMHDVPFSDFPEIYKLASCFVYPSYFEGFGIPILEAIAVGTPVATSNLSSMPEVGGNAALYFNPDKPEDIADKINMLLNNQQVISNLATHRETQLNKFSQPKITENVMEIYKTIHNSQFTIHNS